MGDSKGGWQPVVFWTQVFEPAPGDVSQARYVENENGRFQLFANTDHGVFTLGDVGQWEFVDWSDATIFEDKENGR